MVTTKNTPPPKSNSAAKPKTPVQDDYVESNPTKIKLPEAPKYDGITKFHVDMSGKASSNTPAKEQQQTLVLGVVVIFLMTGIGILYMVLF